MLKEKILVGVACFSLVISLPCLALAADKQTTVVSNVKPPSAVKKDPKNTAVQPNGVGAVGTISCTYESGDETLYCPWEVTSSSRITYVNTKVTFSDGFDQPFNYPTSTQPYQVYDSAQDAIIEPGTYYAELSGSITTLDGLYPCAFSYSDDVVVN